MKSKDLTIEPWVSLLNQLPQNSNIDLKLTKGTTEILWEDTACGHQWTRRLSDAVVSNKCPYCSGKRVLAGFNDLNTLAPNIAAQWHPTLNILAPYQVSKASNKKVWWQCEIGHEWEGTIYHRTLANRGCPVCTNQKIIPGFNDLKTINPELANQWHPTLNGDITPDKIAPATPKKYWWTCNKNHEWEASPNKRQTSRQGCPVCANQKIIPGINDIVTTHPQLLNSWSDENTIPIETVSYGSGRKVIWKCENGHKWESVLKDRLRFGCPKCPTRSSRAEKEISDFLLSKGLYVENSVRNIISSMELDIYIPEKKIAIEYNGLYWHSEEKGRHKTYHYDKWLACKKAGIQLIQIWEDTWTANPKLVKNMLAHKLGVNTRAPVYARKTEITEVPTETSDKFLELYHIQGAVNGGIRVSLQNKATKKLVALMVLKKEPNSLNTLNLLRYATAAKIPGGFTKLIKYVIKHYSPTSIITFSDHMISDGSLYETNGFVPVSAIPPDYMYVVNHSREHKFNYRVKQFKNNPNLKYEEGLTERELAVLNGLTSVWDAGKTKWVLTYGK